jgi:predicted nucleotidyltransferase
VLSATREEVPSSLLSRIVERMRPVEVWLFGSRARGGARQGSDWDLLVVLPDDASEDELDLMRAWQMVRDLRIPADVAAVRKSELGGPTDRIVVRWPAAMQASWAALRLDCPSLPDPGCAHSFAARRLEQPAVARPERRREPGHVQAHRRRQLNRDAIRATAIARRRWNRARTSAEPASGRYRCTSALVSRK